MNTLYNQMQAFILNMHWSEVCVLFRNKSVASSPNVVHFTVCYLFHFDFLSLFARDTIYQK